MGLLLSVLISCVGVLEVIACYTHFRVGVAYNECKSNIRDIAKNYAVELRKHELHFESGPGAGGGDASTSQQTTLSELIRKRNTVRVQEKSQQYGHTPDDGTPVFPADLAVPRNSITGLDSPTVQRLISPEVNITEAIAEKIQNHENDAAFWTRKSPSPMPDNKSGLEIVDRNFWRSRSPSPFPETRDNDVGIEFINAPSPLPDRKSCLEVVEKELLRSRSSSPFPETNDNELIYTPGLRKHRSVSPLLDAPSGSELVDKDYWNSKPVLTTDSECSYSKTDLEVQNIITHGSNQQIIRPPSPCPDILFGITENNDETKFDEEFLRSLDGVKSAKCDDRRRSFRKKRNSSSTSSRASREDLRSLTSLEDNDLESSKKIEEPRCVIREEDNEFHNNQQTDINGLQTETIFPEKCASLSSQPKEEIKVTKQEETKFQATVSPNETHQESITSKPANLSFTEKVKDLEISVQLLVTVKGTSQGDQMQYVTTVSQDDQNKSVPVSNKANTITKSTEEKSEFGKVKTSVTYGNSNLPPEEIQPKSNELKDLQIVSQSLIHAERTLQDDVVTSEEEFLKLYESFTELPPREKDKFLKIIGQHSEDSHVNDMSPNLENPPAEIKTTDKNISDILPKVEESKNVSDSNKNELVLIKEITEITESIERVTTIPPVSAENVTDSDIIHSNKSLIIQDLSHNTSQTSEDKIIQQNETEIPSLDNNTIISTKISNELTNIVNQEIPLKDQNEEADKQICEEEIIVKSLQVHPIPETNVEDLHPVNKHTQLDVKAENSSSSSSETPSTAVENILRKASKNSFEDASSVQNQEMLKRRVSASEISPKQASQAFWLIFSAEYTNAMEKDWHGQHFSCWQCDESLTGQRYVLREEHPYCVKCYEQVFANTCEKCNRIIGIDSKDLSYKEKHWHEACFQCTSCNESLVDKQFGAKGEKIYCGNCYDKQFASRCDGCGKIFHAGTKKMEYKNRQWHEQCFKCCKCETPIGTKSFIPREKDIYCAGCYEEKFATRCVKCNKAIQSGGVTYKNEPWHRECFTCTHCDKNLAGQRFTSRDDKPCCAECFGRLFAKRCTACNEPITGIGGTRFISFEDRHWHNDCFICAVCTTSLVGRGFITDEDKIICPECAKERFM